MSNYSGGNSSGYQADDEHNSSDGTSRLDYAALSDGETVRRVKLRRNNIYYGTIPLTHEQYRRFFYPPMALSWENVEEMERKGYTYVEVRDGDYLKPYNMKLVKERNSYYLEASGFIKLRKFKDGEVLELSYRDGILKLSTNLY